MNEGDFERLAWDKMGGLIPATIQDAATLQMLMLGYMNVEALRATLASGFVTFHSRSRGTLWQKGETSGNRLALVSIHADCDGDALLVKALPAGPVCHRGTTSCFDEADAPGVGFIARLAQIVALRSAQADAASYTARLLASGRARMAQKVGEEGVEVALAAVTRDAAGCAEEVADLVYHLTVLMQDMQFSWQDVSRILADRHDQPAADSRSTA